MTSGAELNPFLEAAPDAIVIVDSTGRIVMINAQTERLFGYRRDELLRKVRALPPDKGGDTPAVAVPAHARSEDRERALAAGFRSYVAKPIDRLKLIEVVALAATPRLERAGG